MFVVVALVFLWLRPRETSAALAGADPGADRDQARAARDARRDQAVVPARRRAVAEQQSQPGESGSGRLADIGPALQEWRSQPLLGQGFGTRVVDPNVRGPQANILDNQWLGTLLETGSVGFFGWLWFFVRVVRRLGKEAKEDDSDRGWLLVSIAAGVAAFAVGMFTYDAFAFIQVTFLMFIFVGLGAALLAERPTPLARRSVTSTVRRADDVAERADVRQESAFIGSREPRYVADPRRSGRAGVGSPGHRRLRVPLNSQTGPFRDSADATKRVISRQICRFLMWPTPAGRLATMRRFAQ